MLGVCQLLLRRLFVRCYYDMQARGMCHYAAALETGTASSFQEDVVELAAAAAALTALM